MRSKATELPSIIVYVHTAPRLSARDDWIGWDAAGRSAGLDRVVGMSRFLIRRGVCCRNLASKALALCLRRLGADFLGRYGILPLLVETFVGEGYSAMAFSLSWGECQSFVLICNGLIWLRDLEPFGRG